MSRDYSQQDYEERCSDIELAMAATKERVEEWDESADPHGWWHDRPQQIAFVNEVTRLRDELENMYRLYRERGASMDELARAAQAVADEWTVRGDGGCSLNEQVALRVVLARYQEAKQ